MKINPLYICYSAPQKDYLIKQGAEVLVKGLHTQTHNPFWVFMKSDELNSLLTKWSEGQKDNWMYGLDITTPGIDTTEY